MSGPDISNEDRRTLANLAVPRTAAGLAQRMASDPDIAARSSEGVHEHVSELVSRGLVVILGEGELAEVAASNDEHGIGFGKGQKKLWLERLEAGKEDAYGNFYVLSEDGLNALKGGEGE